jgi:NAD-dependent deacetylase
VWFGEEVPLLSVAAEIVAQADVLVVVGTSLQVYPAASLAFMASEDCRRILIDPRPPAVDGFDIIAKGASEGLADAARLLGPG